MRTCALGITMWLPIHFALNFTAKSVRIMIISRGDMTCFCDYKIGKYSKIDPVTCERHPQKTRDAIE